MLRVGELELAHNVQRTHVEDEVVRLHCPGVRRDVPGAGARVRRVLEEGCGAGRLANSTVRPSVRGTAVRPPIGAAVVWPTVAGTTVMTPVAWAPVGAAVPGPSVGTCIPSGIGRPTVAGDRQTRPGVDGAGDREGEATVGNRFLLLRLHAARGQDEHDHGGGDSQPDERTSKRSRAVHARPLEGGPGRPSREGVPGQQHACRRQIQRNRSGGCDSSGHTGTCTQGHNL